MLGPKKCRLAIVFFTALPFLSENIKSQIYSTIIDTMGQIFPVGILLLEETGVPEENHEPAASHRQTLSHNVVPVHLACMACK
jgi:hypothetical protein